MNTPTQTERCLPDEELRALASGSDSPLGVTHHLSRCERCRARLAGFRGPGPAGADDNASTRTATPPSAKRLASSGPPPEPVATPEAIGKYRLLRTLGQGGQATAYLAVSPLGKNVVIKLGRHAPHGASWQGDQLVEEGKLLTALDHPHIARVLDVDQEDGRAYLVLEHIPGRTIAQAAAQGGLALAGATRVLSLVADALEHAHRRGIVHRDLKPDNVLLRDDGTPCVIDFGIATLRDAWSEPGVAPGEVTGTLQFMAPEQARGETARIGPRTDVFALGGILYFLLTGKAPFAAETPRASWEKAAACQIDLDVLGRAPSALQKICRRALAERPEDRFPTAAAFGEALRRHVRRPAILRVGALVALLAALGVCAAVALRQGALPEVEEASLWVVRGASGSAPSRPERLLEKDTVAPGDLVYLRFRASGPTYLYVGNEDTQGNRSVLFPTPLNSRRNPLAAGELHELPLARVTTRGGEEHLTLVACAAPMAAWENAARLPVEEWRTLAGEKLRPLVAEVVRGMEALGDAEIEKVASGERRLSGLFTELDRAHETGDLRGGSWRRRVTLLNPR